MVFTWTLLFPTRCVKVKVKSYGKPAGHVRHVHNLLRQFLMPCFVPHASITLPSGEPLIAGHYSRKQSMLFSGSLFRAAAEWCSYRFNLSTSLRGLAMQPTAEVVSYLLSERNIFISLITEVISI